MRKHLITWAIIWLVVGIVVYLIAGQQYPDVVWGIALAAIISLGFMIKSLSEEYEGEIIEIKQEERYVSDDDGGSVEKFLVAILKQPNGTTKKLRALKGYQVGTYIIKKKGESVPKVYEKKPEA